MQILTKFTFINKWLTSLVVKIEQLEDYFCDLKRVQLSEWSLFLLIAAITFSFVFFDVENSAKTYQYIMSELAWTIVFVCLFFSHILAFAYQSLRVRYWIVKLYAMIFTVWTIITSIANPASPMWELFLVFTIVSVIVAVRLNGEFRGDDDEI